MDSSVDREEVMMVEISSRTVCDEAQSRQLSER